MTIFDLNASELSLLSVILAHKISENRTTTEIATTLYFFSILRDNLQLSLVAKAATESTSSTDENIRNCSC